MNFQKESLLYIAMVFTTTGGVALSNKEYLAGSLMLLCGAGLVIARGYLKGRK